MGEPGSEKDISNVIKYDHNNITYENLERVNSCQFFVKAKTPDTLT